MATNQLPHGRIPGLIAPINDFGKKLPFFGGAPVVPPQPPPNPVPGLGGMSRRNDPTLPQGGFGPATADAVAARWPYRSLDLNRFAIRQAVWESIVVDRPTILWPLVLPRGVIYYAPNKLTGSTPVSATTNLSESLPQHSTGCGIVYLPTPGVWWLYYDGATSTPIDCSRIDASDPGVASRYLSEPGCNDVNHFNLTGWIVGQSGTLVASNRLRKAIMVQNNSTNNVRISLRQVASVSVGLVLNPQGSVTLDGNTLSRFAITYFCPSAAAGNDSLNAFEFV